MDIITHGDLRFLAGVILILCWLGKTFAERKQKLWGGLIALAAFLAYAWHRLESAPPRSAEELYAIALRALVTFGITLGFSWIVLALLTGIIAPVVEAAKRQRLEQKVLDEAMKAKKAEDERRREAEERLRQAMKKPPSLPPAPVPTQEEVIKKAKERYDRTLQVLEDAGLDGIEMKAARQQAKKRYLSDLNEVLR